MNTRDRKRLSTALGTLPTGFTAEEYDDFINYRKTVDGDPRWCRVLRLVGPARFLVVFHHHQDVFKYRYYRSDYSLLYLNEHNELVEFDPESAQAEWRKAHGKPHNFTVGWERAMVWWLGQKGARPFKGRGWADDCAMKVRNLIARWQKHYSGGTWRT